MATRATGHGDGHVIVFAPSTVQEMADLVDQAFSLGDRFRVPVMILADGLLGQMMEPVELPEKSSDDLPAKAWAADGHRFKRAHNTISSLFLDPQKLEDSVLSRRQRYELISQTEQKSQSVCMEDAEIAVVAYGAASRIARSAINKAREAGVKVGLIRPVTLWPFPSDVVAEAASRCKALLSVELCCGQMVDDVRLAANGKAPVSFFGHTGGIVPTPDEVCIAIERVAAGETIFELPFKGRLTRGESGGGR
jgi:2-oxoglutarate ferredoxin oxidoreductase subunit alpha